MKAHLLPSILATALTFSNPILTQSVPTRFPNVTWTDSSWTLATTVLDQGHYQSRMSLANGYIGINVASVGPFFEIDTPVDGDMIGGWPMFERRQTFATIAGFYDSQPRSEGSNFPWLYQYGGESLISGVPHWSGLEVEVEGVMLRADVDGSTIDGFESALDMKNGVLRWRYEWTPVDGKAFGVEYTMFVNKLYVNQAAVQLRLTPQADARVTVSDVLDGECAVRTDFVGKGQDEEEHSTIWSAVRPWGIDNVTAWVFSTMRFDGLGDPEIGYPDYIEEQINGNQSTTVQRIARDVTAGGTYVFEKFVGVASDDAFAEPQRIARNASLWAATEGFDAMLQSHSEEWQFTFPEDSVDAFYLEDGSLPEDEHVLELHILAVASPFQILQNTVSPKAISASQEGTTLDANSVMVGGLGSAAYAGMVFWDADVWIAPGLAVSHPQTAKQVAQYRVAKYPQAKENINTAYTSSKNEPGLFSNASVAYPWTSARFGNCTGTGPCFDYEYHLNGVLCINFYNYWVATGHTDYFQTELFPIYESVASFFSELLYRNESTGLWGLTNATDPDEFANNKDNIAFTLALMESHFNSTNSLRERFNQTAISLYQEQATNIDLPIEETAGIILEYKDMNATINVKQADVVLIDDFLDYENPYALTNLDYYAGKQSRDGPAMTYGVFSIDANTISPSGCSAYTYDLYGTEPYLRAPFFQFSEQLTDNFEVNGGFHPAYPFITGVGGANRVAIFGYLGLRLLPDTLNINPNLPPQISRINYRTFYWQGHAINATSNQTHTTLSRIADHELATANPTYLTSPIPVSVARNRTTTYPLSINSPVSVPNRQIGNILTWPNNLCQCHPIAASSSSYIPGQLPLAAIDGAISTKWQPSLANETAYLTVDLGLLRPGEAVQNSFFPVREIRFDWGQSPPTFYEVVFSNTSLPPFAEASQGLVSNVTRSESVEVSNPYVPERAFEVVPYVGNTTNVTLSEPVWSGRYATLVVSGNQHGGEEGEGGCTVAEFAVIRD